jgi:hypothetical protein
MTSRLSMPKRRGIILICSTAFAVAATGWVPAVWGGSQALAACAAVTCEAETVSTGLASPPSWATGRLVHFEPSSRAVSSFSTLPDAGLEGGSGEGPLLYHPSGDGVQHEPKVHVIFWGSNFNTAPGTEVRSMILKLYEGLSKSAYQGILTQYFDSTGRVSPNVTVASYIDTSVSAPKSVDEVAVEEEVSHAIKENKWSIEFDNQFVVITAPGSTYAEDFGKESNFCAYHGYVDEGPNKGLVYSFVPYQGDPPFSEGCLGTDREHNPVHKTAKSASHEYAESATDPALNAWFTSRGEEVADICQDEYDLELPDGAWAQNLYDDHLNECSHEDLEPPHIYAVTEAASEVEATAAELHGTVNAESVGGSESAIYHFEYGTTTSYGSSTPEANGGSGTSNDAASQVIDGLAPGTTYHFRVVATNITGTTKGKDQTFTTPATSKPYVETRAGTRPGETKVTLNGIVNPDGLEAKYYFEYGTTTSYGSKTAEAGAGSGTGNLQEDKVITGLPPGTTYHYRIVAVNSGGTSYSADAVTTTGPYLELQATPNVKEATTNSLNGVSCLSSSFCMATGLSYTSELRVWKTLAERWNGAEWSILSTPNPSEGTNEHLKSVSCFSATACTAVGYYENSSKELLTLAERWNGTEWTIQSTPNPLLKENYLESVSCTSATWCVATGTTLGTAATWKTLAEVWNGTEWTIQTTPNPTGAQYPDLIAVSCTSSTACTAFGNYQNSSGTALTLAERWNGTVWTIQSTPNPSGATGSYGRGVSCTSTTFCAASGQYTNSSSEVLTLAERWNGTEWTVQSTPNPTGGTQNYLNGGVSCATTTACTAVGTYVNSSGTRATLAEYWNGTEWTIQSTPNPSGEYYELQQHAVSCVSSTTCTTIGESFPKTGPTVTLAEMN